MQHVSYLDDHLSTEQCAYAPYTHHVSFLCKSNRTCAGTANLLLSPIPSGFPHPCCRPPTVPSYTLQFNGNLGRQVMDAELAAHGQLAVENTIQREDSAHMDGHAPKSPAKEPRRVLIGHSLGAACAAAEVIENPKVRRISRVCRGLGETRGRFGGSDQDDPSSGAMS